MAAVLPCARRNATTQGGRAQAPAPIPALCTNGHPTIRDHLPPPGIVPMHARLHRPPPADLPDVPKQWDSGLTNLPECVYLGV